MKKETGVFLAYLAVCFFWGTTYLAIRIGVSELPPQLFAGIRFVLAAIILLVYAYLKGLDFPENLKEIKDNSIVGLFLLFGANGLVVRVEQWVHSGVASVLLATVPLFLAFIEYFVPDTEGLDFKGWVGLLTGFSGVFLLISTNTKIEGVDLKGVSLLLLASFLWAAGSMYSKSFKKKASSLVGIGIQMLAGGIALCLTGLLLGELKEFNLSLPGLGALLYLIVFGSIVGYGCYIYVLQNWPASRAGTYAYVNPLVAIFLGWLVLGEPLSFQVILAGAIILSGVIIVQTSKSTGKKVLQNKC